MIYRLTIVSLCALLASCGWLERRAGNDLDMDDAGAYARLWDSYMSERPATRFFRSPGPRKEGDRTVWDYDLTITETRHVLADGTPYKAWAFGGQVPGPLLVAREGDWIRIRVTNETTLSHTIHSHGLHVPQRMDGAPHHHVGHAAGSPSMTSAPRPIEPGETFIYEYIARPAGTHFYHCHVNTNEHMARGMSGPLIVLPKVPDPPVEHDVVLFLQEWDSAYARLGKPGHPREARNADFFTINGQSYPKTKPLHVNLGDAVRIRIINAGSQEHYIHLHGHTFLLTHKDGVPLNDPIGMDTVPVGPGERQDIVVRANNPGDWPMHCHSPSHITNAGQYPGGMMTHLVVGPDPYPTSGPGPIGPGVDYERTRWRDAANRLQGP